MKKTPLQNGSDSKIPHKEKILIAEDDQGLNIMIGKLLKRNGFHTDSAATAEEVMQKLSTNSYSLLILDYMLGNTKGEETVEQIRNDGATIPFILITGQGDEKVAVSMMKLGARDYIVKDMNFNDFLPKAVQRVFEEDRVKQELEQTANALHISELRRKRIFDSSPDSIIIVNSNADFLEANLRSYELLGIERPEDWMRCNFFDFVYPDDRLTLKNVFDQIRNNPDDRQRYFVECRIMSRDGKMVYTSTHINPALYEHTNETEIVITVHDISTKKKAEVALRESESRYKLLASATFEGIAVSHEGTLIELNQQLADMHGYTRDEVIGQSILNFIAPDSRELVRKNVAANFGDIYEYNGLKKDGTIFPVETKGRSFIYGGKTVRISMIRDISERKMTEEKLIQSEERFRGIFENATIGIYRSSVDGQLLIANNALLDILGYDSFDELKSVNLKNIYADEQKRHFFIEQISADGIIKGFETGFLKKDGSEIFCRIHSRVIRDKAGNIMYFEGIIEDVSKIKAAEKALIIAKNKAEESSRLKTSLLANMSHELRTPMNGIIGFASMLEEDLENEEEKLMAQKIVKSGTRLMNTLKAILDLSVLESDNTAIQLTPTNIVITTKIIAQRFEKIAEEKGLRFSFIASEETIHSPIHNKFYEQALLNIIDNAVKFTEKGEIIVEVVKESMGIDWSVIKVRDTGIGISQDHVESVFHEFKQVSEGFSRTFEGTGLGLTIVKKMVERMNGKIEVSSNVDQGSTFTLRFPAINKGGMTKPRVSVTKSKDEPAKSNGENRLLLIEDNLINKEITEVYLRDLCIIDHAENADDALEALKDADYELILMDINLGAGMNGVELMKKIRQIDTFKDTPIIALTGYAMIGDREKLLQEGFTQYLPKPFQRVEIRNLVESLIC